MSQPEQQACRIVLVRHGETAWNLERRLQGQIDTPLNARGEQQARAVATALATETFDAIHSSDLQRAFRTAEAIAAFHPALTIQSDGLLRERDYGAFEGSRMDELPARFPKEMAGWEGDVLTLAPPGGESRAQFHERVQERLRIIAGAHAGQTLCVVAHGGVLDAAYRAATGVAFDAARTWAIVNAGINRLTIESGRFSLQSWGEDAHLAALM